eukprot:gene13224-19064_t
MAASSVESKVCQRDGCGKPITGRRTKFCSDACQKGKSRRASPEEGTPTAGGTKVPCSDNCQRGSDVLRRTVLRRADVLGRADVLRRTVLRRADVLGRADVLRRTVLRRPVLRLRDMIRRAQKCQKGKPIGGREPQSKQTTEKPHAEELAGQLEKIAQGYKNKGLLMVNKGQMDRDYRELRASVPDVPGNYIVLLKAPNARE